MTKETEDDPCDNAEKLIEREKLKEFIRQHLGGRGYGVIKAQWAIGRLIYRISYGYYRQIRHRLSKLNDKS